MGLCKCSKKKVTNQFCFEHKVNVCEYCMTSGGHQTCIVGPYLQWLENSSFDLNCVLCRTTLTSAPCVRLCCYHIIHLECLNNYASQLPPNTAPAGYVCPICTIPIFSYGPGANKSSSPVRALLEKSLSNFSWAREGIGLDFIDPTSKTSVPLENSSANGMVPNGDNIQNGSSLLDKSTKINMSSTGNNSNYSPKLLHNNLPKNNYAMSSPISVNNVTSFISTNSDLSFGSTSSMRSKFDSESRRTLLSNEIAEDKYRTKSPIEFLSRWLRTRTSYMRNQPTISGIGVYKKFIIYGLIAFLLLFVLVHFFLKFGRQSAENDPFLDPKNDPNFRNQFE